MAVWPASLPQAPNADGYAEHAPKTIIRTEMEAGPPKMRRRFTAGIRPFEMKIAMTKSETQVLDAFFVTTLVGGSLAFDWIHPRTGAAASFRFVKPPTYSAKSDNAWDVALSVEVLP
jgi:hypothetical protein